MSEFAKGLIFGGNIFRKQSDEDASLRQQHDQLLAALREVQAKNTSLEADNLGLRAEIEGDGALLDALKNALKSENPEHPLVFPLVENEERQRIFENAYYKALNLPKREQ